MSRLPDNVDNLLAGPLVRSGDWPLAFLASWCDLRPRFLPKCRVGSGFRAVARNGRVLLASDASLDELMGRVAAVRLQTWNKAILAGDTPTPYGVLLCVRSLPHSVTTEAYQARLAAKKESRDQGGIFLTVDVGGGMVLEIFALSESEA
jgi:hypothetical protein